METDLTVPISVGIATITSRQTQGRSRTSVWRPSATVHQASVSPTTLYKHGFDEVIKATQTDQLENAELSGTKSERQIMAEQKRRLEAELAHANERNNHLIVHVCLVEANAALLGIDPEEFLNEIVKPVRDVSWAERGYTIAGRGRQ